MGASSSNGYAFHSYHSSTRIHAPHPTGTTWNPAQASDIAVPSSATTGAATATGTTTSRFSFSTYTGPFSGGDDSFSSSTPNNIGASVGIALGVILGLWALTIVAMIIVFCKRQNQRKAWYGPMAAFYAGKGGAGYGESFRLYLRCSLTISVCR